MSKLHTTVDEKYVTSRKSALLALHCI